MQEEKDQPLREGRILFVCCNFYLMCWG